MVMAMKRKTMCMQSPRYINVLCFNCFMSTCIV